MDNWKDKLYANIEKIELNKKINNSTNFLKYVESEANKLVEPILKEYPRLVYIKRNDNSVTFRIEKCELCVEIVDDIGSFYQVNNDESLNIIKTVKFTEYALLLSVGKNDYTLFSQAELDDIFKQVFKNLWSRPIK